MTLEGSPEERLMMAVCNQAIRDFVNPKGKYQIEWSIDAFLWLLTDGIFLISQFTGISPDKVFMSISELENDQKKRKNLGASFPYGSLPKSFRGIDKKQRAIAINLIFHKLEYLAHKLRTEA